MARKFNISGTCLPDRHYMVDLSSRLAAIKEMVDAGDYFTINRARQYGKTTTLNALVAYLKPEYDVISLDFQGISSADYESEQLFVAAFSRQILLEAKFLSAAVREELSVYATGKEREATLSVLFMTLLKACEMNKKKIVLLIDEVDSASNNQVFLDFLAQLRYYYLKRPNAFTFQSVILAGVYDIRSLKRKIRPDESHKVNSPWNIAAKFRVNMDFSAEDIAGMLNDYEADYHTGMDVQYMSRQIFEVTSGYPYLVSDLCKIIDEDVTGSREFPERADAWTGQGFQEAVKLIEKEDNTLYESLLGKLTAFPEIRSVLYDLLFTGRIFPYNAKSGYMKDAAMFGFVRNEKENVIISNRIFENVLYNFFISEEVVNSKMFNIAVQEKNQFVVGGRLDVRRILEKFIETFGELYGDEDEAFLENEGRKYFLLFLKPIINGAGNYSIEPQTRNSERMDVVIYYRGEQNILELKIWRGNAYNERSEQQLSEYLDYFHMRKGYMLSFNFNKKKERGIREISFGDKLLVEAVV
ncbi:MAG: AAA-like domain-containing protein [Lachnospiraceae bacterium]|nr:AAA-like domain-containing protein [Lachnospiraceae bacterium]